MITEISIEDYYKSYSNLPVIDVRSPGEYKKGHIPNAFNIALFNDDERAQVGTMYVQVSREKAIELGYRFVEPKLHWFIDESIKVATELSVVIHCWRGGMRSKAFAEHLDKNGFKNVYLIKRGYKAFRKHVLSFFDQPFKLKILGGFTGSGKTLILQEMHKNGQQVIDLEGLANHKGSAFGSIGQKSQPTVEQFENNLFHAMNDLDLNKPIWIEDESHSIGKVYIPIALFKQMREQIVYFIDIPEELRAKHLTNEYAQFGNDVLAYGINGIAKRLGGQNVKRAHECLKNNNYFDVAIIALQYYDKAYLKGLNNRDQQKVKRILFKEFNPANIAKTLIIKTA